MEQIRQTAFIVKISEILDGKYIKQEGWEPNYILIKTGEKISRVNLICVVISEKNSEVENQTEVLVDDGFGKIPVREFSESKLLENLSIGDLILLVGRPREYGGQKYILPEIVKKIKNKDFLELRKLELEKRDAELVKKGVHNKDFSERHVGKSHAPVEEEIIETADEKTNRTSVFEKILGVIKKDDSGSGVSIEDIVISITDEDEIKVRNSINSLLENGEIFEIKQGMLKILD